MSRVLLTLLSAALLVLAPLPLSAKTEPGEWHLRYNTPAKQWTEALPVGNGRMGAMVFGGVAKMRLQLNEDSLWTGQPHSYAHPGAADHLGEIRELLFEGKQKEAEKLASRVFMSQPLRQQSYQPLGDLVIRLAHGELDASDYSRRLDLGRAIATTTYKIDGVRYTRRVIASHPDEAVVVHLECDKPGQLSFYAALQSPQTGSECNALDDRTLLLKGRVSGDHTPPSKMSFAAGLRVIATDGQAHAVSDGLIDEVNVREATWATVAITARTSFADYKNAQRDPRPLALSDLERVSGQAFDDLLKGHVEDHRGLFDRVSLSLGEPPADADELSTDERLLAAQKRGDPDLAALLFNYGRYLMIASSRPGGQPANLQGLWNKDLNPAWDSKYTCNINTEMNYWLTGPCGLDECNEPLFAALREIADSGSEVARVHYDAPGWVLHHNFDIWRGTAPINASDHGIWPTGGAWLCQHLWMHYQYSGDADFLRNTAYPLMKGSAEFFLHYLVEDSRTDQNWLISGPSNSPEQGGLVMGPTMDHQIIRNLLENTAAASELLRVDEEFRDRLRETHDKIAPNQIGKHGQLQEWLEDKDDPNNRHRHVSHLWGLHPGREITPDTPELFSAARKSLEMRGDGGTGWSRAWKINFWARLRDGDHAHKVLQGLMTLTGSPKTEYSGGGLYANLFDAHPPFQIDGNFGATAGVCEMLLQSHLQNDQGQQLLDLLPALPTAWPSGKIEGLRARSGYVVDLSWQDGELSACRIQSTGGAPAVVRLGEQRLALDLAKGESIVLDGSLKEPATNGFE